MKANAVQYATVWVTALSKIVTTSLDPALGLSRLVRLVISRHRQKKVAASIAIMRFRVWCFWDPSQTTQG